MSGQDQNPQAPQGLGADQSSAQAGAMGGQRVEGRLASLAIPPWELEQRNSAAQASPPNRPKGPRPEYLVGMGPPPDETFLSGDEAEFDPTADRPTGVTVKAYLTLLAVGITLFNGIAASKAPAGTLDHSFAPVLLFLALLTFATAYGLFHAMKWSWYVSAFFDFTNIVSPLVLLALRPQAFTEGVYGYSVLIVTFFVVLLLIPLLRNSALEYFRIDREKFKLHLAILLAASIVWSVGVVAAGAMDAAIEQSSYKTIKERGAAMNR